MGSQLQELLGICGITKSWSKDIDLCNGPLGQLSWGQLPVCQLTIVQLFNSTTTSLPSNLYDNYLKDNYPVLNNYPILKI